MYIVYNILWLNTSSIYIVTSTYISGKGCLYKVKDFYLLVSQLPVCHYLTCIQPPMTVVKRSQLDLFLGRSQRRLEMFSNDGETILNAMLESFEL